MAEFFAQIDAQHSFKVGMDSCNVPGAMNFCKLIFPESLDTCEGGRFSCYIGADMIMVPCSFDQAKKYSVVLKADHGNGDVYNTIEEAWNSDAFERFRDRLRMSCPDCPKRNLCLGGCPLMPEIVFCNSDVRTAKDDKGDN